VNPRDVLAVAAIAAIVFAGSLYMRDQSRRMEIQAERLGELHMANAAQNATIRELRDTKKRDDALVADTAEKLDKLATRIQSLDCKTQEALRNAPNLTLDSVLPAAAADAFCLQWHEASGLGAADYPGNAAGGTDARTADSAAAKGGAGIDCRGWRKMTVRDAVEWNGLLLRHAGLERGDKAALRRRAKEKEN